MWYRDDGDLLAKETYVNGSRVVQIQYKEDGTVEFEHRYDNDTLYFIKDCIPDCESGHEYVKLEAERKEIVSSKLSEMSIHFSVKNKSRPIDSMTVMCDLKEKPGKYYTRRKINDDTIIIKMSIDTIGDFCLKCTIREYVNC